MTEEKNINHFDLNPLPISKETGDALAKPIATSLGDAGKTVLDSLFHFALDPLRRYNIQRSYALEKFENDIRKSVSEIPSAFLDDSKTGIVLKTIEDSRYQLNEEQIRELFTKLITSTFDSRVNANITPKFSSIIADMSPSEARLLEKIHFNFGEIVPFVDVKIISQDGSERLLGQNFLLFDNETNNLLSLELSLLESSNLIHFHRGFRLTNPHFRHIIEKFESSLPKDLGTLFCTDEDEKAELSHSYYSLTELGKKFCNVVFK